MSDELPVGELRASPVQRIGKYEVVSLLGQGAMGEVYLAEDPHIGRRVAIKVMKTAHAEDRQRFLHEARIVGSLSHPNIVVLHDFGFHDEKPYLVLEYLSGISLDAWLRNEHSLAEHLRIVEGLLSALTHAHGLGVLHRDLKPSNIQVLPSGQCKLMDFGIARGAEVRLTATGMVMGTPSYMAPEIVEDAQYSPRADLYSAAVVAYEMLAGGNPFHGQTLPATINNVLNLDPPRLSELRPTVPRDLADAVMACLAKDPERRPADLTPLLTVVQRLRAKAGETEGIRLSGQLQMTRTLFGQASTRRRRRARFYQGAAALALVAVVGIVAWRVGRDTAPASPVAVRALAPDRPVATSTVAAPVLPSEPPPSAAAKPVARAERRTTPRPEVPAAAVAPTLVPPPSVLAEEPKPTAVVPPVLPPVAAASPTAPRDILPASALVAVRPRSARRGAMLTVQIQGTGLRPEQKARVLRGREDATAVHVTRQSFIDPTSVRLTLLVDEDAPVGIYSVALVDDGGRFTNSLSLEVIL